MEIDCLICGQIGMCTFVSSPATIQDNNDCSNNQEKSKWSKCFCELLGVNTELVPEIEGILQSSYYCNHCIPDLQFIYETFCEIEALRESLNSKKDECKVKLRNASLKCNAAAVASERSRIDTLNQFVNVTAKSDDDDEDFTVPVEFDFHSNPNSPSQTLSRCKLLRCLNSDSDFIEAAPLSPELDPKVESKNNYDAEQEQLWTLPSYIFENETERLVENISVRPEEMKSVLDKTKTNNRVSKPKRFQRKASESTEAVIVSNREQESLKSKRLRSRRTKIQNYSKLNSNPNSGDEDSSDNVASSRECNSDYSVEEGLSKSNGGQKRKLERIELFLPTVLSDQDTIKNIELLEKEYDVLIKYHGIKKLRIPVIKLPNDDSDSESENNKIDCKCPIIDCKARFFRKYRLVEHIRAVHRGMKYPYECKICNKKYRMKFEYKQHLNIHSKKFPYSCSKCDYKCPTQKRLQNHEQSRHSLSKFQCDQCGLLWSTRKSYQAHLRRHSSGRPFVCEVCDKSFKFARVLRYHRTVHPELNLEQFKCEVCGKVYSHPYNLKQHMRGHTGNLPFLCDKCDFRTASTTTLKLHMSRHTEGKPYECEACHAKYKNRSVLARHKKYECGTDKDSRDFVCDTCGKEFRTVILLKAHERVHKIVGRPFLCYMCGSSYTRKENLKRHLETSHKKVDIQESSNKNTTDELASSAIPEILGSNFVVTVDQVETRQVKQVQFPGPRPSESDNGADPELINLWPS